MDLFNPANKETDILIEKILKPLFGYESKGEVFFSQPMEIFLNGCLVLVALLVIYNLITATTDTANTGKVLGQKTNLTWNILRNVVGIGLLLPLKGGLAVAQIVFIWLVGQGLLLGNSIYEKMDFFKFQNQNLAFISNIQGDLLKSYRSAVISNACVLSAQRNAAIAANGQAVRFAIEKGQYNQLNNKNYVYKFGEFSTRNYEKNTLCGSISVSFPAIKKGEKFNINAALDELNSFSLINTEEISKAVQSAHLKAMDNLLTQKAQSTANLILNSEPSEETSLKIANKISEDLQSYEDFIRAEFNNVQTINDDVKQYITKYGIASAGSWMWALSNSQSNITNIVNDTPKVLSTFNTSSDDSVCSGFSYFTQNCKKSNELRTLSFSIPADMQKAGQILKNAENFIANKMAGADNSLVKSAVHQNESEENSNKFLKLFDGLSIKSLTVGQTEGNPFVAMQSFGQKILMVVQSVIAGLLTASFFSSVGTSATIAALPLLIAIAIPAIMIVFYFPFLPFIIWMGAITGWIVMIIQGLLGIPLWLISFLRNSDDFVGKTGQGYLLVLEAFLRPALLIFSLFFAYNLMSPVVSLINFFFIFVGNSIYSNTSGFLVLVYYIFAIVIYAVLINKTLKILLMLMETIPDKILTWLGSSINSIMSNAGKELDNTVEKGVTGNMGTIGGAAGLAGNGLANIKNIAKPLEKEKTKPELQQDFNNVPDNDNLKIS